MEATTRACVCERMAQVLTCTSAAAVRDPRKSPVAGLTAVTAHSADPRLARALAGHRVTRDTQRTNHVALTEIYHPASTGTVILAKVK